MNIWLHSANPTYHNHNNNVASYTCTYLNQKALLQNKQYCFDKSLHIGSGNQYMLDHRSNEMSVLVLEKQTLHPYNYYLSNRFHKEQCDMHKCRLMKPGHYSNKHFLCKHQGSNRLRKHLQNTPQI